MDAQKKYPELVSAEKLIDGQSLEEECLRKWAGPLLDSEENPIVLKPGTKGFEG